MPKPASESDRVFGFTFCPAHCWARWERNKTSQVVYEIRAPSNNPSWTSSRRLHTHAGDRRTRQKQARLPAKRPSHNRLGICGGLCPDDQAGSDTSILHARPTSWTFSIFLQFQPHTRHFNITHATGFCLSLTKLVHVATSTLAYIHNTTHPKRGSGVHADDAMTTARRKKGSDHHARCTRD